MIGCCGCKDEVNDQGIALGIVEGADDWLCSDCCHGDQEIVCLWVIGWRVGSFQREWCRLKSPMKTKGASEAKSCGYLEMSSVRAGTVVKVSGGL